MTMTVIARVPLNYADFGMWTLTPAGVEHLNRLIAGRLPDDLAWCGDEILGPLDFDAEEEGLDIYEIIDAAKSEIMEDSDHPEYWEDEENGDDEDDA